MYADDAKYAVAGGRYCQSEECNAAQRHICETSTAYKRFSGYFKSKGCVGVHKPVTVWSSLPVGHVSICCYVCGYETLLESGFVSRLVSTQISIFVDSFCLEWTHKTTSPQDHFVSF